MDKLSRLSADPMYVHNSSTTSVNKMFDVYAHIKSKKYVYQHCFQITIHEMFHRRKSVQRNLTCNTSERKTRDFYTILSGCPQNWPIYPLYFSFDELFVDLELFLLQWTENWTGQYYSFQCYIKWTYER